MTSQALFRSDNISSLLAWLIDNDLEMEAVWVLWFRWSAEAWLESPLDDRELVGHNSGGSSQCYHSFDTNLDLKRTNGSNPGKIISEGRFDRAPDEGLVSESADREQSIHCHSSC
ncbi:hypothetical protein NYO67_1601 [Aspergillus flavus]|nr:hypothetical protein NYO67_1601 [Aspergillus flavus]